MAAIPGQHGTMTGGQRLGSIDVLRGLAALAVVFVHIPRVMPVPGHSTGLLFLPSYFGGRGVILFLVLSGFCIHLRVAEGLARGNGVSWKWTAFWRRRFVRLYPPYLAAIVFSLVLSCFLIYPPWTIYGPGKTSLARDLGSHLLMIHNLLPSYSYGLYNSAFWTLGLEEQLYLLYAVFLLLRWRLPAWLAYGIPFGIACTWFSVMEVTRVLFHWTPLPSVVWAGGWPFGLWFVWLLGALAAEVHTGVLTIPRWCYHLWIACLFLGLGVLLDYAVLTYVEAPRWLFPLLGKDRAITNLVADYQVNYRIVDYSLAVSCFILVNRWVRLERIGRFGGRASRWLGKVGVISYSLYLTHVPVITLVEHVYGHYRVTAVTTCLRYVVYVPLCLGVAWGFFRLIEKRFLNARPSRAAGLVQEIPAQKAA